MSDTLRVKRKDEILKYIQDKCSSVDMPLIDVDRESIIDKFADEQFDRDDIEKMLSELKKADNCIRQRDVKLTVMLSREKDVAFSKKYKRQLSNNFPIVISLIIILSILALVNTSTSNPVNFATIYLSSLMMTAVLALIITWVFNFLSDTYPMLKKINDRLVYSVILCNIIVGVVVYGGTVLLNEKFSTAYLLGVLTIGTATGVAIRNNLFKENKTPDSEAASKN